MVGLGVWEAEINTIFFKGTGRVKISDVNGNYDFKIEIEGMNIPEVNVYDIVENGNTLTANAECDIFKGKKIPVSVTFDGDTVTGIVKAPMVGKLKFNGRKIA